MKRQHEQILRRLRKLFPQPVSNQEHDAYFVFSFLKALDQVDSLKSQAPMLGAAVSPNWEEALAARMPDGSSTLEAVVPQLVKHLEGMFIWGHPHSQINVITSPTIASIIGVLLPSIYNPNLCSEESSRRIAQAEVEVLAMIAELIGYDPAAVGGLFTFGGTGALLYGVKIGLEKALPGTMERGLREEAVVIASDCSHYACLNVAGWLGLGQKQVIKAPTSNANALDLDAFEMILRQTLAADRKVAAIVATMGTTDAFGIDDLHAIVSIRDRLAAEFQLEYVPHIHADAVIGWAWSVFNDYSFEQNPLGFRGRTLRALAAAHHRIQHLHLADSLGIDFHKTCFAPYVSSLFVLRDQRDWRLVARHRELMPYLFQSGQYHPAMYSLETTRSGCGPMAALANLLLFGKEGLQVLLGHAVEMAEVLREGIESHPNLTVLNGHNVGPVTLFRAYPPDVDTFTIVEHEQSSAAYQERVQLYNDYNRRIFELVHAEALAGSGVVISLTDSYRTTDFNQPIVALKSYILSPFCDEAHVNLVLDRVVAAQKKLDAEMAAEK